MVRRHSFLSIRIASYSYLLMLVLQPQALSMVWYMVETGPDSMGTFIPVRSAAPSHPSDAFCPLVLLALFFAQALIAIRNPRGPKDGITVTAPIPGDMQVSAPAGSASSKTAGRGTDGVPPPRDCGWLRRIAGCRASPICLQTDMAKADELVAAGGGSIRASGRRGRRLHDRLADAGGAAGAARGAAATADTPLRRARAGPIQQPVLDRAGGNERNAWASRGWGAAAGANAHVEVAVARVTTAIAKL